MLDCLHSSLSPVFGSGEPVELLEANIATGISSNVSEILEGESGFSGSKSDFLNRSFAGSAGIASLSSLPGFTGSVLGDWLNSIGTFDNTMFDGSSGVGDVVADVGEEAKLLQKGSFHSSFNGFGTVFLSSSFAWSVAHAPLSTFPGLTSSPFHIWGSHVCNMDNSM